MGEELIKTDVDKLIEILKIKKKMEIKKMAQELNVSEETVQQWVDFLVEEKILIIEYDLTQPIISLAGETTKGNEDYFVKYKQNFQKDIKKGNSEFLWKQHILENVEQKKIFFFTEAEKRDLTNAEELWEEYKKKVTQI